MENLENKKTRLKFEDFKDNPQELVGMTVLYESGASFSRQRNFALIKIKKVTKTGFRLLSKPDALFDLTDGYQKGLNSRADIATISRCELVTDEEADRLRKQWKRNKEEKVLREKIRVKIETISFEQLQSIDVLLS